MANQTVVSAAAIWQGLFDTLTADGTELDFVKQGEVYFVDGNAGVDTNDGKSWETAFKKLSVAMAVSHANIAVGSKGWASRNKIYCKGDTLAEDLTKLAQKTDIIGVGSCDDQPRCRIEGTHVIEAQTIADYMGCRFFNIEFIDDGASICFALPANQNGIEFHNCVFTAEDGCLSAIRATSVYRLKIIGCKFLADADGNKFANNAIKIAGTTTGGIEICNNLIVGTIGIDIDNTNAVGMMILNNIIVATTFVIDDESDDPIIAGNLMTSAANEAGAIDHAGALAVGNILTTSEDTRSWPFVTIAING